MSKTTDNLVSLINAGGNLTINVSDKTTDNIIRLVRTSVLKKRKITLTGLENKTTDNIIRIIRVGGDYVHIEL